MSTLVTLQDIMVREFKVTREQLVPAAALDSLGVDSLDLLELMFKIEDAFGVSIREDTPTHLATVEDVVNYIDALLARAPDKKGTGPSDLRSST